MSNILIRLCAIRFMHSDSRARHSDSLCFWVRTDLNILIPEAWVSATMGSSMPLPHMPAHARHKLLRMCGFTIDLVRMPSVPGLWDKYLRMRLVKVEPLASLPFSVSELAFRLFCVSHFRAQYRRIPCKHCPGAVSCSTSLGSMHKFAPSTSRD